MSRTAVVVLLLATLLAACVPEPAGGMVFVYNGSSERLRLEIIPRDGNSPGWTVEIQAGSAGQAGATGSSIVDVVVWTTDCHRVDSGPIFVRPRTLVWVREDRAPANSEIESEEGSRAMRSGSLPIVAGCTE